RHQLAGRAGDSLRGDPAQGVGRQPDLGRGAGAVGPDVGMADVLAAGAFGPGLPQSIPTGHAGASSFSAVTHPRPLMPRAWDFLGTWLWRILSGMADGRTSPRKAAEATGTQALLPSFHMRPALSHGLIESRLSIIQEETMSLQVRRVEL